MNQLNEKQNWIAGGTLRRYFYFILPDDREGIAVIAKGFFLNI